MKRCEYEARVACAYWCNRCGGSGAVSSPWPNENDWQCGVCHGTGHAAPHCTCGTCSAWFSGKLDVQFLRELGKLRIEG